MRYLLVELSPSGGLFQFSYQLGSNLAQQGHLVELITGRRPELVSKVPGFTVNGCLPTWHPGPADVEPRHLRRARRPVRAVRHVVALATLVRHVRRRRPDVVMWHSTRFPMDAWALLLAQRLSPDVLFTTIMHETRPLAEQRRSGSLYRADPILMRSIRSSMRVLDVIYVLGDGARRDLIEHWQPQAHVEVIPHGDEGVFLTGGDLPAVATTGQSVLFFGTWIRHKGLDVLLDAFEKVQLAVPEATLTIAGAVGGDVDYESIRARAAEVGHVTLRPGYVPIAEVADLFGRARVVAVPYLRANQSGVVHLAHTFGRPVVATAVGDIPSVVRDGITGRIIPPGDASSLATSLQELLLDPEAADRLGREGRRRLESQASWADIASRVNAAIMRRLGSSNE